MLGTACCVKNVPKDKLTAAAPEERDYAIGRYLAQQDARAGALYLPGGEGLNSRTELVEPLNAGRIDQTRDRVT
jgi:hypothetical protein